MRVSEVVRLRYRDLDFDRNLINVWQGKGRRDHQVMLPMTFAPLLRQLEDKYSKEEYLFPATKEGRYPCQTRIR